MNDVVWCTFFMCVCGTLHTQHTNTYRPKFCFVPHHATIIFFTVSPMHQPRRPYYRGGNPLPTSYRNKALLIIGATVLYTAWLHQKGMLDFCCECWLDLSQKQLGNGSERQYCVDCSCEFTFISSLDQSL